MGILAGILTASAGKIASSMAGSMLSPLTDLFKAYFNKQITQAELAAGITRTIIGSAVEIEKSENEMVAKTSVAYFEAVRAVPLVAWTYAIVTISLLLMLAWEFFAKPVIVWKWGGVFPDTRDLVPYVVGLLALCLGGGTMWAHGKQTAAERLKAATK